MAAVTLPKKHRGAGSSEQVPTYALSQIDHDYGHTVDTFEIAKSFACVNKLRKGHFAKFELGYTLGLVYNEPPTFQNAPPPLFH